MYARILKLFVCYIFLTWNMQSGFALPPQLWDFLKEAERQVAETKNYCVPSTLSYPSYARPSGDQPITINYLAPRLVFWDPISEYQHSLICPEHGHVLVPSVWRNTPSYPPRWLYGRDGPLLLIQRNYICKGHEIFHILLSGEATLTNSLPNYIHIPFALSHRAGYTMQLETFIINRIMAGSHFWQIENELETEAYQRYLQAQRRYCLDTESWRTQFCPTQHHYHTEEFVPWTNYAEQYCAFPSDTFMQDIFLLHHKRNQHLYNHYLQGLPACSLSCDHTFKVSVNIGFNRQSDNKWITQYDSLFMVANELGQILQFQFTKSTAFEHVCKLLEKIQNNLHTANTHREHPIQRIFLDNCCHWRSKVNEIFPHAQVSLDLFHAVQRIGKTIRRTNPFRGEILSQLSQVFRQPGDIQKSRRLPTPDTQHLIDSFDEFVNTWTGRSHNGESLFSQETKHACQNLAKHIRKGCLSDVPPGAGTNHNERFHKFLNSSSLAVGRLGPELALAILTVLVYKWNISKVTLNKKGRGLVSPIEFVTYGLHDMCCFRTDQIPECALETTSQPQVNKTALINTLTYEDKSLLLSAQKIFNIWKMVKTFRTMSLPELVWCRDNRDLIMLTTLENDTDYMDRNLANMNLQQIQSPPDGNCLFHSIAIGLTQLATSSKTIYGQMDSLNIHSQKDQQQYLRQLAVREIITHKEFYAGFCSENSLDDIESYKSNGVYLGELGDLMLVAMSNVLCIPFIVVTARRECAYIVIQPKVSITQEVVYVAYHHSGNGHYNGAVTLTDLELDITSFNQHTGSNTDREIPVNKKGKGCRCGTSAPKGVTKTSCLGKRCPCAQSQSACDAQCRCIGCKNPIGHRHMTVSQPTCKSTRKRRPAHVTFKKKNGSTFLHQQEETPSNAGWTDAESLVCHEIVRKITEHKRIKRANWVIVMNTFNRLAQSNIAKELGLDLRLKTRNQILGKVGHIHSKFDVYKAML